MHSNKRGEGRNECTWPRDLIARGRGEVEAKEVLVEGGLRELRLRVQERRSAAASSTALREGLLRRRRGRTRRARPAGAVAPSGPPGREDGDGADVARLVDLKLHRLLR
uniref:Uncharacterized protein n=1 Tax=Arundo donax TaxID=35708 RepID=A0A0A9EVY5_ARUDO